MKIAKNGRLKVGAAAQHPFGFQIPKDSQNQTKKFSTWSIDPADLRKILQAIPPSGAEFESSSDLPDVESANIL